MAFLVFVSGLLIVTSFVVAICSFMLHFCHHFEFHEEFRIAWCCSNEFNDAPYIGSHRSLGHVHADTQKSRSDSFNNWSRKLSHRTSVAAAIFADEVKQNNCCCCHVMRQRNVDKDQLLCCLYSSVSHMEFYPLAVTLYFIILISVISFTSITIYFIYYKDYISSIHNLIQYDVDTHQLTQYCNIQQQLNDIKSIDLYNNAPITSMKQSNIHILVVTNYILIMFLIQWESLLNWYRFYSTKFMSLRFTTPPYLKIFGFFSIYTIVFVLLCVAQMYIAFLLFPIIIILHVVFNSYCISGFIKVLNNQYKHYVEASQGVSDLIINDLRDTMKKLKLCAIWCIISSTAFLLTFTLCHFGDIVILSAPLWWIINCICWMFTFAKNALWFKHQSTNCVKICHNRCCISNTENTANIQCQTSIDIAQERMVIRRNSKNRILSKDTKNIEPLPILLEVADSNDTDNHLTTQPLTPQVSPLSPPRDDNITPMPSNRIIPTYASTNNHYKEDKEDKTEESTEHTPPDIDSAAATCGSIKLQTILDGKEYKESPTVCMSTSPMRRNISADTNISKYASNFSTPMSIIITPAGDAGEPPQTQLQTRMQRTNSGTYQYPTDYEDDILHEIENDNDDYFTFPSAQDLDVEVSITNTTSKKPKALDVLGVMEYEESKTKPRTIFNFLSSSSQQIEPLHVPNASADDFSDATPNTAITADLSPTFGMMSMTKSLSNFGKRQRGRSDATKRRRVSKTMSHEASHHLWELIVGNGLISSQTVKSLHELEEYTVNVSTPVMSARSPRRPISPM